MHSLCRILINRNSLLMHTRSQTKYVRNYTVKHDSSNQEYHMKVDSEIAKVEYVKDGDVLDLTHSYIPESHRGQGLGHILAKGTFDEIEKNNLKIKISCTFLQKFYEENKNKYKHLVVD